MQIIRLFLTIAILLWADSGVAGRTVGFLIPVSGLGDQSFNDMTYAGLVQAKNKHNFKLIRERCKGNSIDDRMAAMDKLIAGEADIIVANGYEFRNVVDKYARLFPALHFIINDIPMPGFANVYSTVFGQHEGAFLAGALAAWFTREGKIGFIGGKDMPVIRSFLGGYREGASYAQADVEVLVVFLSSEEEESSGFDDPGRAYSLANNMYAQGVDVIFSVAGLSGNGVIRSAVNNNAYVIGVDADQDYMAKGNILTSVIKRLDKATLDMLSGVLSGKMSPGVYSFGLKENGVALSPMTYTRHLVSTETTNKLEILREEIIAGKVKVTDYLKSNQ